MKVKEFYSTPVPQDIEVKNAYFAWLVAKTATDDFHWCLLRRLHQKNFYWLETVPRDENRESDGTFQRQLFAEDSEWNEADVLDILAGPCSVLEMLVALATRIEQDVMYDSEDGDRTGKWFQLMLKNAELTVMDDSDYHQTYVDHVLERIMSRCYSRNSKGSLFPVKHTHGKDWRTIELWMQMQLYFSENGSNLA